MPELIHFTVPPAGGQDAGGVRAILATHLAHEGTKTLRQSLVRFLAAFGGLAIGCLLFPAAVSESARQTLLGIWAVCFACAVAARVVEWRLLRQEADLLATDPRDLES
jgi:hypothetical protein